MAIGVNFNFYFLFSTFFMYSYFTFIFCPGLIVLPEMPFFFFNWFTVKPLRLAMDDKVSPFFTVTDSFPLLLFLLFPLRLELLLLLLRE